MAHRLHGINEAQWVVSRERSHGVQIWRYCINPFNSDVTGHKPSKFPKNFGSHRSLGGRPNCFQMWSRFFLPSIASCPKNPPGSHVMNGLSEMSLSDIGVTGHTPVRIDHIDTVVYHEACHEVECAIANVCQPWCQPHCSHALQFETGYGCIAVSPSRSPSFCRQALKSMQATAFFRVGSVDSRRF